ncbi:DsbA family protein [Pseudomonas luteola]
MSKLKKISALLLSGALALGFVSTFLGGGTQIGGSTSNSAEVKHQFIGESQTALNQQNGKVLMFFWYGCPHCYHVHKEIENHNEMERYTFVAVPGNDLWTLHARHYYTMKEMGLLPSLDSKFFELVYSEHSKPTDEQINAFLTKNGVSLAEYQKVFISDQVKNDLEQARAMTARYNVTGTPSIFIDGNKPVVLGAASSYADIVERIKAYYATSPIN